MIFPRNEPTLPLPTLPLLTLPLPTLPLLTLPLLALPLLALAFVASSSTAHAQNTGAAPATNDRAVAGYHKGFFIRAADAPFDLTIQGRIQARYALEVLDGAGDDAEAAFSIPRARLVMAGHAFTDRVAYKFQADFGKGFVFLKDFYVDYTFVPGWMQLRVGQWKRPFSRQQITSSGNLELVDRAVTDKFFGVGSDIGFAIHNDYEHSPAFEYALGIFNGTGAKSVFSGEVAVDTAPGEASVSNGGFSNVPDRLHPALVARVGYNYGGIKGYSEADLEGGGLRFAVGASGLADLDADNDDVSAVQGELDYALKLRGFASTGAVYVATAQSGPRFTDQSFAAVGMHVQAGYLVEGRFQPVVRYAFIAPDGPNNDNQEITAGVSVYFFQHGLKWQTDAGALIGDAADGSHTDALVRSQLQLAF